MLIPFILLLLSGCSSDKQKIKDTFCGVNINAQHCKCAFHNHCDAVGMNSEETEDYVYDK